MKAELKIKLDKRSTIKKIYAQCLIGREEIPYWLIISLIEILGDV